MRRLGIVIHASTWSVSDVISCDVITRVCLSVCCDTVMMTPQFTTINVNRQALNVTWFVTSDDLDDAIITVCYRKLGEIPILNVQVMNVCLFK